MTDEQISWIDVNPGKTIVGSNNRSILFGGLGPRHEVSINYNFKISKIPVDYNKAEELLERDNLHIASESEWELAYSRGLIITENSSSEILADNAKNYWGKICDGRPNIDEKNQSRMLKIWDNEKVKSTSFFYPNSSLHPKPKIRLVSRENIKWKTKSPKIPDKLQDFRLLKEEILITTFLGIIPSFSWAFFNASRSYIYEGWLNLLFGGLLFGFSTIIFWRPIQPTWYIKQNEMIPK